MPVPVTLASTTFIGARPYMEDTVTLVANLNEHASHLDQRVRRTFVGVYDGVLFRDCVCVLVQFGVTV